VPKPRLARRADARPPPSKNRLLAALPESDYRRIAPLLTTLPLTFKQVLHRIHEPIDTVYFPGGGVCSLTNTMADGRTVEVATIGNEGMVGITIFQGGTVSPGQAFVQVPDGVGQSMTVAAFKQELNRRGPFYQLMGRYSQALQVLIMQSTACNTFHTVEERCARWLLMTHDRIGRDDFQLTHEFLGFMLGVRRPTVSLVLGTLHKAGVIDNGMKTMKKITVVDRKGLEEASCECYKVVRDCFDQLLPDPSRKN